MIKMEYYSCSRPLPRNSIYKVIYIFLFILLSIQILIPAKNTVLAQSLHEAEQDVVNQCMSCKLVANSVKRINKQPSRFSKEEQSQVVKYMNRLKTTICSEYDTKEEKENCREYFFKNIPQIELWHKREKSKISLYDHLCIKERKVCCPWGSYGVRCQKCSQCGVNERCYIDGVRAGNGSCVCIEGHEGERCRVCSKGYYIDSNKNVLSNNSKDDRSVRCSKCHKSCVTCRGASGKDCEVCRRGFEWVATYGCLDIDECVRNKKICGQNTFCINTEGSYFCYQCDRACDGCHGDGPDMCLRCAKDYKIVEGSCVAMKKRLLAPEANYYRYVIYVGMGLSTVIILQNNVLWAAIIGLAVALYIGASEYIMSTAPNDQVNQAH